MKVAAKPRNSRKPRMSVTVVTKTAEDTAGSNPEAAQQQGDAGAGESGHDHVAQHGQSQNKPQHGVALPHIAYETDEHPQQQAVNDAQQHFSEQEASSAVAVDFSQGEAAHNQGQGLGAADATLPGNHRQEGGQDDQLLDGGLEEG